MPLRPSFAFAFLTTCLLPLGPLACSSSSPEAPGPDGGGGDSGNGADAGGGDGQAAMEAAPPPASCDGGTCIQHVVIIVQENHTFDTHFGAYCTAPAGSNPTCNDGPACCEAMPATDPSGNKP
ncbi:MAG TPA: alkaline phosphatase family protein, partial [Polyangiaceae bacterium]